jgi:hypothetical protein
MPLYNSTFPPYAVQRGIDVTIVNNEQLGVGNFSQRCAIAEPTARSPEAVTLTFSYASKPAAVEYDIWVGWDDTLGVLGYTNVGKTTNVNGDQVTIQRGAAGGQNFRLVLVQEVISPGVNALVQVRE